MKRVFLLINLLILAASVYVGSDTFRKVSAARKGHQTKISVKRPESAVEELQTAKPFLSYNTITERNLFQTDSELESKPEKPSEPVETLKQTELNVKLWGTVTGLDGATYAVIEEGRGAQQYLYKEGDTVQNALIKSILREKVVLTVKGNDEILEIERMEGKAKGRRVARAAPAARRQQNPPPPQNIVLNRADLAVALEDTDKMMQEVRIRPHFTDGKPDGLMLTGIRPRSIFRKMGLRNGDILLGVDENDIRSVNDAQTIYQNLQSASQLSLQIKRRGRPRTFNYTIK